MHSDSEKIAAEVKWMTENKDMLAQLRKTVQAKLRDTQKDPDLQFVEEGIKQLTPEQMERAKELIDKN